MPVNPLTTLRRSIVAASLSLLAALSQAAPLPAPARAEVDALLSALQASGCEFNRNGSWYPASEAKVHLLKKLDYLEGKDAVRTADQFIELGASTSSVSGKPYLVRCGKAEPVESRAWLGARLAALRSASRPAASAPK